MYLQIPIKLEQYVDEIKRNTNNIEERNKFTLVRLGVTENESSKKLVYLLYNPFAKEFRIDANFFTSNSKIFKLYPSEFLVAPNSAVAFVAYITTGEQILIDESKIVNNLKDTISQRIKSKYNYSDNEVFEAQNNLKIKLNDVDFSNTMYLDPESITHVLDGEIVDYSPRYEKSIGISLENIDIINKEIKLEMKFTNDNDSIDIRVSNYRLKIFDLTNKLFVNVETSFVIKRKSSKISTVYLNKIEFDQIERENMQLKVTIL